MTSNVQALLDRRAGAIVGREREQAALRASLVDDGPVVTHVCGIAGVGKSALMRWLAGEAAAQGVTVVALDGREVEPTEQGLRTALGDRLGQEGRVLLLVDTYELLTMLDPWMRRTLIPELSTDVRVVLAGREAPSNAWLREYGDLVRVVRLENLPPDGAEAVLRAAGLAGEDARRVNRVVGGHPLGLVLAGAAIRDGSGIPLEEAATGTVVEQVARTYLDALDPDTRRVLEAASVTRRTTLSLLGAELPGEPPGDAFARLRALPFVELGRDGLVVHDAVREATAMRLKALDPRTYRAYRTAAWRCLRGEMRTATRPELWRYTADMLYLIEDRSVRENFFPAIRMDHDVTPAEPGDWDAIAALAADAPNIRGGVEVLRAWWEAVPEAFAVARDAEGRVAGFRCACEPHEVSPRVLDVDPVGSEWRAHLRTSPIPKGQRAVWARYGVRRETTEGFDAALAALLLDMKRLYVAKRPELRRIYTEPLDGSTAYCAMTLGYVPVPGRPRCSTTSGPARSTAGSPGSAHASCSTRRRDSTSPTVGCGSTARPSTSPPGGRGPRAPAEPRGPRGPAGGSPPRRLGPRVDRRQQRRRGRGEQPAQEARGPRRITRDGARRRLPAARPGLSSGPAQRRPHVGPPERPYGRAMPAPHRRDLPLLAGAVCLSSLGDLLAIVALALHVHEITGSALAVSALFATTMLPAVVLAPLAGRLADRIESVRLLALSSGLQAVVALGLAFTTSLAPLLVLALLLAAGATVSAPAEFSLVPAIARKERLAAANGTIEAARSAGFALGPVLAAVAVAVGGTRLALLADAASFLAIVAAAGLIRARRRPVPRTRSSATRRGGAQVVLADPVLRPVVLAAVGALLFVSAAMTIEVVFAAEVLRIGEAGYAMLVAASMVGMTIGSVGARRVAGPLTAAYLVLNVPAQTSEGERFAEMLEFETLTLCPIDTRCIERALLRDDEVRRPNAYHAVVRERLASHVHGNALAWLHARTEPLHEPNPGSYGAGTSG